jgi:hypothetical protein
MATAARPKTERQTHACSQCAYVHAATVSPQVPTHVWYRWHVLRQHIGQDVPAIMCSAECDGLQPNA